MKKLIFYIPAILFAVLYGILAISDIGAISSVVIVWLLLFLMSGIILSKGMFWGSVLGFLPAIHLMYMGTQETGQVANLEWPLAMILLLYYTICGYFAYKKRRISKKS